MSLGTRVRGLFGRYEATIAEAYRSIFVDLDGLVETIGLEREPRHILEVGCGEGAVTSRLARAFPRAEILGIDVTSRVGRLFDGDRRRVSFEEKSIDQVALERPAGFDLVVVADVIHHVPPDQRPHFLSAARTAMTPDGVFVLKDWIRSNYPIHALCWASDRFVTGDVVHFCTATELRALVSMSLGERGTLREATLPPWSNNRVLIGTLGN
jgi:cyclopropane fatty-acyl-phospholipid synthase-like methyltransferase